MSLNVYPTVRGLTWPVIRTPEFSNLYQRAASGKEIRLALYQYPLRHWELSYGYLKDNPNDLSPGASDTDLAIIQSFYEGQQGGFSSFLFDDPTDDLVQGQLIGTGDGTTTQFQLSRTKGSITIPIQNPFTLPPPVIYLNGVVQSTPSQYSIGTTGIVTFVTAPGAGVLVTADFNYYWQVRFEEDKWDFEQFMFQLYRLKSVKFVQVVN
jgi:uncharacterized protein (TIGR02217 family)